MGKELSEALIDIPATHDQEYNSYYLESDFYSPGYLAALTAFLKEKRTSERGFDCDRTLNGYLETLGLYNILWDRPAPHRVAHGRNYTPITQLSSAEATDDVTTSINGCIRHFTGYTGGGLIDLTHVVGELLDNVWSHGQSTGFAMAQKTAVPHTNGEDHYLEFSVADRGIGFLEETRRTGKAAEHNITTDLEAINWCIQRGNSTKHADDVDEWAQQIPPEHIGESPYGSGIGSSYEVNHHQGLGLAHLVELVQNFHGKMIIASGNAMLTVEERGNRIETELDEPWKGVAISCKFRLSSLVQEIEEEIDEDLMAIIDRLKGDI
ncbi:hypothetical protein K7V76_004325 [Vibrio fluvialis]|nr:hypothetical protein [Vibrio fluvialis]EKO3528656.1 hypothetical protein [Vibrio fluvialis]